MSRFRPLEQLHSIDVTRVTCAETGIGYTGDNTKSLINKELTTSVTTVTNVTTHKTKSGSETGGGMTVATRDIFRARLEQVSHDLPVDIAVLIAEFANDAQDIAAHQISDEVLRKAVFVFVVYHLGLQPVPLSTPTDDGMIQCSQCTHWWNRCRHPDKYRGWWPDMQPDRWRRCNHYQKRGKH